MQYVKCNCWIAYKICPSYNEENESKKETYCFLVADLVQGFLIYGD